MQNVSVEAVRHWERIVGASTPQKQGGSKSPRRKERGKEQKNVRRSLGCLVKIGNQRPWAQAVEVQTV